VEDKDRENNRAEDRKNFLQNVF